MKPKKKRDSSSHNMLKPEAFFRRLGIKPIGKGEIAKSYLEKAVSRLGEPGLVEALQHVIEQGPARFVAFFHSRLDLAKIYYGGAFEALCQQARLMGEFDFPAESRVLYMDGILGLHAFWVAATRNCPVTVADNCPKLLEELAQQVGESRVSVIDASLPDLEALRGHQFEVVVLCQALDYGYDGNSLDEFFDPQKAKVLQDKMEECIAGVEPLLAPQGRVIVIQDWDAAVWLPTARAFEAKHLRISNAVFRSGGQWGREVAVVFSKNGPPSPLKDHPLALAVSVGMGQPFIPLAFEGITADSLRRVFEGASILMLVELEGPDGQGRIRSEILEKDGFALLYRSSTDGSSKAVLSAAVDIPGWWDGIVDGEKAPVTKGWKLIERN